MRYLLIALIIFFTSCGVRKTEKTKHVQKNSVSAESFTNSELDVKTVETKLSGINHDVNLNSQSYSDEHTELTADSIDYNVKTGSLKAKGNVKLKKKQQSAKSDSSTNKTKEIHTEDKKVSAKVQQSSKAKTEEKAIVEDTTKATKRNNTAATVLSVLVMVIGLIVYLACKK